MRSVCPITTSVRLRNCHLSSAQITDILNSIVEEGDLALEELHIGIPNNIPLSLVDRVKERLRELI